MERRARRLFFFCLNLCVLIAAAACGGGSGNDGTLLAGTLTEGGDFHASGDSHLGEQLAHSTGERIAAVTICALRSCSETNNQGEWGFVVDEESAAGTTVFSVLGHGIDTEVTVNLPAGAHDIFIDFVHAHNEVRPAAIVGDGVPATPEHEHPTKAAAR